MEVSPVLRLRYFILLLGICWANHSIADCNPIKEDEINYNQVKKLIEECEIHTIEALLPHLPESYRSSYLLLHHSRSGQSASPENPRVILFGKDAKLILAFNGDPSQSNYHFLETIEFDDK